MFIAKYIHLYANGCQSSIKSPDTNVTERTLQISLRLRLLKIEFAFCILVAAEHTNADEQSVISLQTTAIIIQESC